MWEHLSIHAYDYGLPQAQIASHPLLERDASRLLLYDRGVISDRNFKELPELLPPGALLVRNNTRVVPARLLFAKESGAIIEVFCLEPVDPKEYNLSFARTTSVVWRAMVGNIKRWKNGVIYLYNPENEQKYTALSLSAACVGRKDDTCYIRFNWQGGLSFAEVLALCGKIPIPPYIGREAEPEDRERYQTIYALWKGSVAAPTAGLHFSDHVISCIKDKNIEFAEVTLHVGAGTFTPVKTHLVSQHNMHSEPFSVSKAFLETLYNHKGEVIAVGTTSARCIESLYYFGLICSTGQQPDLLPQWEAYRMPQMLSRKAALEAILQYMHIRGLEVFEARTQIMIVPSFPFRFTNGLITNFHQPKSTLLLLIAAFIGEDWRRCYEHALAQNYRFLSYGDSSLLLPLQGKEKSLPL